MQLGVAEIAVQQSQQARGAREREPDARGRAGESEQGAFAEEGELELAPRDAERAQQAEGSAPPQGRQRLRREHEERARPQRDQRQHVQIDAVRARDRRGAVALGLRRDGERPRRQMAIERAAEDSASTPGLQREVDAIQAPELAEQPLRRGDVHDAERLGVSALGQNVDDAQISRAIAHDHAQSIAGVQVELGGRAIAQHDRVRREQIERASFDVADEGRLQSRGGEGIETQDLERVAARRQGHFELEHGARDAHGRILRELLVQALRESVARTPYHDVRIAHQALRRQPELVERGGVDEIHRGAERDPESDREHGDCEPAGLLAQLRQQQHPPEGERAAGTRGARNHATRLKGERPAASSTRMRSAVSAAARECVMSIPAPAFALI